jgi:septum site-determining protein MinC
MLVNATLPKNQCYQIKSSFLHCTVLQLNVYDVDAFKAQLEEMIESAPNFFTGASLILDLEKIPAATVIDFNLLKEILIAYQITPMGIRCGSPDQVQAGLDAGLLVLPQSRLTVTNSFKKTEKYNSHTKQQHM